MPLSISSSAGASFVSSDIGNLDLAGATPTSTLSIGGVTIVDSSGNLGPNIGNSSSLFRTYSSVNYPQGSNGVNVTHNLGRPAIVNYWPTPGFVFSLEMVYNDSSYFTLSFDNYASPTTGTPYTNVYFVYI